MHTYREAMDLVKPLPPDAVVLAALPYTLALDDEHAAARTLAFFVVARYRRLDTFWKCKDRFYTTCDEVARPSVPVPGGRPIPVSMVPHTISQELAAAVPEYMTGLVWLRVCADVKKDAALAASYAALAGRLRWVIEAPEAEVFSGMVASTGS